MGGFLAERHWLVALIMLSFVACSSGPAASARDVADANDTGRTLSAKSESERAILRDAGALPSGTQRRIGDMVVVAAPPYTAASGRTCRVLHISPMSAKGATDRLVCSDGKAWFFVPDVFRSAAEAE